MVNIMMINWEIEDVANINLLKLVTSAAWRRNESVKCLREYRGDNSGWEIRVRNSQWGLKNTRGLDEYQFYRRLTGMFGEIYGYKRSGRL